MNTGLRTPGIASTLQKRYLARSNKDSIVFRLRLACIRVWYTILNNRIPNIAMRNGHLFGIDVFGSVEWRILFCRLPFRRSISRRVGQSVGARFSLLALLRAYFSKGLKNHYNS